MNKILLVPLCVVAVAGCDGNIGSSATFQTDQASLIDPGPGSRLPELAAATFALPATIEAEDYTSQNGIRIGDTSDSGSSEFVGWIENNDYTEYQITVPVAGTYKLSARVASARRNATVNVLADGEFAGSFGVSPTGGWDEWETVTTTVELSKGNQTIRLLYTGAGNGLMNINLFSLSLDGSAPEGAPSSSCSKLDNLNIISATSDDDYDGDYDPSHVIDNNLDSESRWSSLGTGRSVILDLGRVSTVRRIATAWYKADVRQAFFDVRTSTNQSNWTTVLSQATATGTDGFIEFDVTDSNARYVEIVGLGNSASGWNSIIEANVFGCGEVEDNEGSPEVPPITPPPTNPPQNPPAGGPLSDGQGINVVFNGGFENGLSGWSQIEPAQGSSDAYEGAGSGKVFDSGSVFQSVYLVPQSRYRVTAWLQGNPTLSMKVGGATFSVTGPGSSSSGDFVEVSFEFNSGNKDTGQLSVKATSSSNSVRSDNIEVVKISGNLGTPPVDPNTVFDFTVWEVEGESPITREGNLQFDALEQCVVTPNGNGCRHEQKILSSERYGLTEQYEFFAATIEANLSPGSETIVVQHHPEATGTLSALYLTDRKNAYPGVENGVARDGIFDVVATVRKPGSTSNDYVVFGTVRSGELFNYQVENDHGELTMRALGTTDQLTSADSSASYLKFGNYLQARDPVTGVRMDLDKPLGSEDRQPFLNYYRSKGITKSSVVFRDIIYQRRID